MSHFVRLSLRFRWLLLVVLSCSLGISALPGGVVLATDRPKHPTYHLVGSLALSSSCFDMMMFAHQDLYLADAMNNQVDVFDLRSMTTEDAIGQQDFTGSAGCLHFDFAHMGPSGVFIDAQQRLWTSNGNSTIRIFSPEGHLLSSIDTGGQDRVDALVPAPQPQAVLAINSDEPVPFVSLIDLHHTFHILDRLPVPGADGAVWDSTHQQFLVAEPNDVAVLHITHHRLQQTALWPLPSCQGTGMTLGAEHQVLIGCGNGGARLVNTATGMTEARIASPAVDLVSYSARSQQYALATFTGPATTGVLMLIDQTGKVQQQISTAPLSHAVFQVQDWLIIPERGRGLMLYRC